MSYKTVNDIYYNNNYERIENITNFYVSSDVSVNEKKDFLRLKREYGKIKKINNYDMVQKVIYKNKNNVEILAFELSRISTVASERGLKIDQINDIQSILLSYKNANEISDELYIKAINTIIRVELALGMKVGLFNELCTLFEDELLRIESSQIVSHKKK